jgi:hypothetical protein
MDNEDLQKQILAMGYPSTRIMLLALVKYFNKEYMINDIENLFSITEIGCLKIDYINITTNEKECMLVYIKECDKDHDLSNEIDKLKNNVDKDKWDSVLKSLSFLILLIRSIYNTVYENNIDLIRNIISDNYLSMYNKLQVDIINTTLYLPYIDTRLGIFFEKYEKIEEK